nr:MAG TPA: hypothetical protein [Caudoviricetes sp.]
MKQTNVSINFKANTVQPLPVTTLSKMMTTNMD